jgi:hypothetical protein
VEALRWELRAQNVLRQAIERDPDSRDTSLAYLDSCLNLISLERGRVEHCQYAARAWKFANAHARHWPEDAILKERWESAKRAASTCAVQSLQGSTEPRATNWFPVSALH